MKRNKSFCITISYWVDPTNKPASLTRIYREHFPNKKMALIKYDHLLRNRETVNLSQEDEKDNMCLLVPVDYTFVAGKSYCFLMPESEAENPDYRTAKIVLCSPISKKEMKK